MFRTRDLEGFLKVFTFAKKRALERYCRGTTVYGSDLAAVIVACHDGVLPFRHRIHYSDIVPEHLVPTDASLGALARNGVGPLDREGRKAARKIFALFDERRWLVGHMFFTANLHEWHFFCFWGEYGTTHRAGPRKRSHGPGALSTSHADRMPEKRSGRF